MILEDRVKRILTPVEALGLVITLALLPIDRVPYLHEVPFKLGLISALLLFLAVTTRLFIVLQQKRFNDLRKHLSIGFLLLLPVAGYSLSTTWAIDKAFAEGASVLLAAVAFRAYAFYLILSEKPAYLNLVRKTIYTVTALVVFFGFFQFFFDVWGASPAVTDLLSCCTSNSTYVFPRVHSTALEPLYLDHFLMIPLWLMAFDFWRNKETRRNKRLIALFIATATLFMLTIARSATIGLAIATLIFYLGIKRPGFSFFKKQRENRIFLKIYSLKFWITALILSALLILMSGVASQFVNKTAQYQARGASSLQLFGGHLVNVADGSARTRYELWPKAFDYFKERPLQGFGADNSRVRLNLDAYHDGVPPAKLQPFNNDALGLMVDLGLLGIITFGPLLAALGVAIFRAYKAHWDIMVAPLCLAFIGMIIQGNFFQSILLTRLWVVVGLILTSFYARPYIKSPSENENSN